MEPQGSESAQAEQRFRSEFMAALAAFKGQGGSSQTRARSGAVSQADRPDLEPVPEEELMQAAAPTTDSPLMKLAQEIHDEVLIPLTEEVMQKLPPEIAGKEGIDVLVRQYVRDDISRMVAALGGPKEG